MTNLEILQEDFILTRNYKTTAYSCAHIDSIIKCNTAADNSVIGAIDKITITESDDVVITRLDVKWVKKTGQNVFVEFEIREYHRKATIDHNDGEAINSDRP